MNYEFIGRCEEGDAGGHLCDRRHPRRESNPDGTTRINQFLEEVKAKTEYRHWFFGHLHGNENLPGYKEHLLYEQIVRID